jgi:hypothetical protein
VGTNKQLRKKLKTLEQRLAEHHEKIAQELLKPTPYYPSVRKWQKDLAIFEAEIEKVKRKLPGGNR